MRFSRRQWMAVTAGTAVSGALAAERPTAKGPFAPEWQSLMKYQCPAWFRDAKLGIWSVWGPECVPEQGDWYARNMYVEGHPQYKHHLETWGHPSKLGYKDIVPLWKAENWDPDRLMRLYQQAGARYFCVIAQHHDNVDCWNSRFHRWNSVNMGPKKDIVGLWRRAALQRGLRFGVTEHLGASWGWFRVSKGADKLGPLAGVPYDGANPKYAGLYHAGNEDPKEGWYSEDTPDSYKREWSQRIGDLVDTYQPDLLYSDGSLPFGGYGRNLLAHFYNSNASRHGGKLEAVYTCKFNPKSEIPTGGWYSKDGGEFAPGSCVQDIERGVEDNIKAAPWQTDTCVGNWYYQRDVKYKSTTQVVQMLADIVSKNGNLLLNFPLRSDGTLDAQEEKIAAELAEWTRLNGEAVFGTRPWRVFGEGGTQVAAGHFNEGKQRYTAGDIRFTTREGKLYAIALGWPESGKLTIKALAGATVGSVKMLGSPDALQCARTAGGLVVELPASRPGAHAFVLRIEGAAA